MFQFINLCQNTSSIYLQGFPIIGPLTQFQTNPSDNRVIKKVDNHICITTRKPQNCSDLMCRVAFRGSLQSAILLSNANVKNKGLITWLWQLSISCLSFVNRLRHTTVARIKLVYGLSSICTVVVMVLRPGHKASS